MLQVGRESNKFGALYSAKGKSNLETRFNEIQSQEESIKSFKGGLR